MVHVNPPKFLFLDRPYKKEEWIELINDRVAFLKQYFDKMPLPRLDDELKILRVYGENRQCYYQYTIRNSELGQPTVFAKSSDGKDISERYGLGTHGIFFYWHFSLAELCNDSDLEKRFWGLTRDGVFYKRDPLC